MPSPAAARQEVLITALEEPGFPGLLDFHSACGCISLRTVADQFLDRILFLIAQFEEWLRTVVEGAELTKLEILLRLGALLFGRLRVGLGIFSLRHLLRGALLAEGAIPEHPCIGKLHRSAASVVEIVREPPHELLA